MFLRVPEKLGCDLIQGLKVIGRGSPQNLQSNINNWMGLTDTAAKGKWVWQHSNQAVGPVGTLICRIPFKMTTYHNFNERYVACTSLVKSACGMTSAVKSSHR